MMSNFKDDKPVILASLYEHGCKRCCLHSTFKTGTATDKSSKLGCLFFTTPILPRLNVLNFYGHFSMENFMKHKGTNELLTLHASLLKSVDPVLQRINHLSQAYEDRKQAQRFNLFSSTGTDRPEKINFIHSIAESFNHYKTASQSFWQLSENVMKLMSAKPVIYGACLFVMNEIGNTYYLRSPSYSQLYSELDDIMGNQSDDEKEKYLLALKEYLSDEDIQSEVNFGSANPETVLEKLEAYTATHSATAQATYTHRQ